MGSTAWGQLDSSSAVLLRSSGKGTTSRENLDSSRYKIRAPESRKDDEEIGERPGTIIATPVGRATSKATAQVTVKDGKATATSNSEPYSKLWVAVILSNSLCSRSTIVASHPLYNTLYS